MLFWSGSILVFCVLILLALGTGGKWISPTRIFEDSQAGVILMMRFKRILTAITVGGALSVAGVAYQAVLRNPLAEPYILGVSSGASLGAAIAIAAGSGSLLFFSLPLCAFTGALAVLGLVVILAGWSSGEGARNIILSGVIIGTMVSSLLMFLLSVVRMETLHSLTWWMLGSLQPGTDAILLVSGSSVLVVTIALIALSREINMISLGEEMAYYLGIPPRFYIVVILGMASLLAALSVTLAGIIGFVGLIVPHIMRHITGADHKKLLPAAFIYGAIMLVLCDMIARSAMYPREIPVGVLTAFAGGPFFLWLINRRRKLQ